MRCVKRIHFGEPVVRAIILRILRGKTRREDTEKILYVLHFILQYPLHTAWIHALSPANVIRMISVFKACTKKLLSFVRADSGGRVFPHSAVSRTENTASGYLCSWLSMSLFCRRSSLAARILLSSSTRIRNLCRFFSMAMREQSSWMRSLSALFIGGNREPLEH